ncbi:MAG: hypothetical protein Q4F57_02435 [Weeksellaceae bacterium]|nr:hypothetical protein [Weeksellaceae bacterium]
MSIEIKQNQPDELYVNQKRLYRDLDGRWIAQEELTPAEAQAFRTHIGKLTAKINVKSQREYWRQQSHHIEP